MSDPRCSLPPGHPPVRVRLRRVATRGAKEIKVVGIIFSDRLLGDSSLNSLELFLATVSQETSPQTLI